MTVKENEFGDKIGKKEICQGILLGILALGWVCCACVRGYQEIKKHANKNAEKAKVIHIQNTNQR